MDNGVWQTILGLFGLLTVAVLMLPMSRSIRIPYTVFLAIIGILLGLGLEHVPNQNLGVVSDLFRAFGSFTLSSEVIFFVFLPALVFESALAIDVRRLLSDLGPIVLLAVVGLLFSAFIVGGAVWANSAMPFVVCLLLGAILSATDPVAVVAIFKELGAPKRLAVLVEGESLFNDATAIVLFNILAGMVLGMSDVAIIGGIADFLVVFAGGVLVGLLMARFFAWVISHVQKIALVEVTLTISLAYLSFLIAEHYLHVSGVMATVTAALVMGSYGRTSISAQGWHLLQETWENLGFWANSLIFVLVGMIVPEIMSIITMEYVLLLVVTLVAAFSARAVMTHLVVPAMASAGLSMPVSLGSRTVMWWGGLRGAVSLALALAIYENQAFSQEVREFVIVLVCGFVLFTLFVNAPTVGVVIRLFGLDRLSPSDLAIRNRAIGRVLQSITANVPQFADSHHIDKDVANAVIDSYETRSSANRKLRDSEDKLSNDDWMKIGLITTLGQERRGYLEHYAAGHSSSPVSRELLAINDDMLDQTKAKGIKGWQSALDNALAFDWQFQLALQLHRRLALGWSLSKHVANRFERLRTMQVVALEVHESLADDMRELVDHSVINELSGLLDDQIKKTGMAVDAIHSQYPEYTRKLERQYLERCAIRQERSSYARMRQEAYIGTEVYSSLESELDERYNKLSRQPRLDLGLAPIDLIRRVPLFAGLSAAQQQELEPFLRPRLSIPGEKIISRGEEGDCMYFVSSGALGVDIEPQAVIVGTGGFVGEMALVNDEPRSADVTSIGFCDLLVLHKREFAAFLEMNAQVREMIETVARERTQSHTG